MTQSYNTCYNTQICILNSHCHICSTALYYTRLYNATWICTSQTRILTCRYPIRPNLTHIRVSNIITPYHIYKLSIWIKYSAVPHPSSIWCWGSDQLRPCVWRCVVSPRVFEIRYIVAAATDVNVPTSVNHWNVIRSDPEGRWGISEPLPCVCHKRISKWVST